MNIIEKLGIISFSEMTAVNNTGDLPYEEALKLEQQRNEMLEALIDQCRQLEDIGFIAAHSETDHPIKIIEKACYPKSWSEIKELLS